MAKAAITREQAARMSEEIDEDDADETEGDVIEGIESELDTSERDARFTVTVSRVTGGRTDAYLFRADVSAIPALRDTLRDKYGTGLYRIRLLKNGKFHKRYEIAIERPAASDAILSPITPQPATGPNDQLATVLNVITQQNAQMLAFMEGMRGNQSTAVDPLTMFEKFANIMASMKAGAGGAAGSVSEVMEAVNKGIELASRINPAAEKSETGLMDIVKSLIESPAVAELVPRLLEAAQTKQQTQPLPRPAGAPVAIPRAIPVAPITHQPAPKPEAPAGDIVAEIDADLQSAMNYLIAKAAKNADVELYADWTLDNVRPEIIAMLLQQENILDILQQPFPAIANHRLWFDRLRLEMISLSQDIGDGVEQQPANGAFAPVGRGNRHNGNVGVNGGLRPTIQEIPTDPDIGGAHRGAIPE